MPKGPKENNRKPQPDKPIVITERKCLMCGNPFQSEGAHNRICADCKSTRAWRTASMGDDLQASGAAQAGKKVRIGAMR